MKHIHTHFSAHTCDIFIGNDMNAYLTHLLRNHYKNLAVIGDKSVIALYADALSEMLAPLTDQVHVFDFSPGEENKTRKTKEYLEDCLFHAGLDRHSGIIALGGGISTDITGFVAATYMRGIPYIAIPTSLVGQIDAAIGGKTGVNTAYGKNLIGTFHHPSGIIINRDFLKTLPMSEFCNGMTEAVKHAVIGDTFLFDWLEKHASYIIDHGIEDDILHERSITLKLNTVQCDEKDTHIRSILNFGHTIGHALEMVSNYKLSHGQAVAYGMLVEAIAACTVIGFPRESYDRLRKLVDALKLIPTNRMNFDFFSLVPFLAKDKKSEYGVIKVVFPQTIGDMARLNDSYMIPVEYTVLQRAWEEALCSV